MRRLHVLRRTQIACVAGTIVVGLSAGLVGCVERAAYRSDVARVNSPMETASLIKRSVEKEMTDKSTVEDGWKWFDRHHVPLDEDNRKGVGVTEISGRFSPIMTQGFWMSASIRVILRFGPDGRYRGCETQISESCL